MESQRFAFLAKPQSKQVFSTRLLHISIFCRFIVRRRKNIWKAARVTINFSPCAHTIRMVPAGGAGNDANNPRNSGAQLIVKIGCNGRFMLVILLEGGPRKCLYYVEFLEINCVAPTMRRVVKS